MNKAVADTIVSAVLIIAAAGVGYAWGHGNGVEAGIRYATHERFKEIYQAYLAVRGEGPKKEDSHGGS